MGVTRVEVKTIAVGPLATNCYILTEGERCIVIDPGDDGERILSVFKGGDETGKTTLQAILLTHAHFDHTMAAGYLQEKTGALVFVGRSDQSMLRDPGWMEQLMPASSEAPSDVRTLSEGDQVTLGGTVLAVWETPGHSPGSLTFIASDVPASAFCGDLIFREGVGRTDLPGGDPDRLFESVDRVLGLPPRTVIYPGHGPSTTVIHEKSANPFL